MRMFLCVISNPKTGVNDEMNQVIEMKVVSVPMFFETFISVLFSVYTWN